MKKLIVVFAFGLTLLLASTSEARIFTGIIDKGEVFGVDRPGCVDRYAIFNDHGEKIGGEYIGTTGNGDTAAYLKNGGRAHIRYTAGSLVTVTNLGGGGRLRVVLKTLC